MKELIKRLEKATGPDRELDDEIHELMPKPKVVVPLSYTRSIDAALTLVPDGLNFVIRSLQGYAEARVGGWKDDYQIKGGQHTVPAIALCIAALKARAAR